MKGYEKTLWENNKTLVDAENLNNIENQIQNLTITAVKSNDRLQIIEDTLPMKANIDHTHNDLQDGLDALDTKLIALETQIDSIDNTVTQATNQLSTIKEELDEKFTQVDDELDTSNQKLLMLETKYEEVKNQLNSQIRKYFDDVFFEDNTLYFVSNNELIKSIKLPVLTDNEEVVKAICGEVICGELVSGQGLNSNKQRASYSPTIWEDGVTPINAANLNNIENKIVELVQIIEQIVANGGSIDSKVHIGNEEPINKDVLWIDNSDETPEAQLDESIIESFAAVLREHSNQLQELFYLSDAYLDDGDFTDIEESDYILEGGIF